MVQITFLPPSSVLRCEGQGIDLVKSIKTGVKKLGKEIELGPRQ
jgi:hypothetical protein